MLNPGDVVAQDYTMINNVNYKDNKENRLSVVLFETCIEEEIFVCTCPITNTVETALKYPDRYYSFPYLLFGEKKYSCVKLNSAHIYLEKTIHPTGLNIASFHMDRIYDKLMNYTETKSQEELYQMIRDNININKKEKANLTTKEIREAARRKRKNRRLKRERIRNAKRNIN